MQNPTDKSRSYFNSWEEKREDVLMQLVAMQRLVEKAEYSPDLAFEYFGYSEQKRQLYKKVVDYMIDVSK